MIDKERYNRHIILPEIGENGQRKLSEAKVLVVGAGGLGTPVLQYLAASGVGRIGIMDADVISLSNLQRQILFREDQIGKSKAEVAKETLSQLNSCCKLDAYACNLTFENANNIIRQYDIVVGATDNFESRLLIDKYSKQQGKPFVHASIDEYSGQVAVFNFRGSMSYADLFPDQSEESNQMIGVISVLPGIIGCLQASEVIKIITGVGDILVNKLLIYNMLKNDFKVVEF